MGKKTSEHPPLIMHIIYRLAMGGLENGLVNLINHMPSGRYRHAIVCLTDFTEFRERLHSESVSVVALHKKPGVDWKAYGRLWKIIKELQPTIVHTRNLPTIELNVVAALAGVPCRIHGEHGRDIHDQYGASKKFLIFRKILRRAIHHYVAVSQDLEGWLQQTVEIPREKISQIYNGVDHTMFHVTGSGREEIFPKDFADPSHVVIGTVGRLQAVKGHRTLIQGITHLVADQPSLATKVRLVIVGDGPLRKSLEALVCDAGLQDVVWMPGLREDIPQILQSFDVFVLPSEAEGISNTILEAMATGLPVLATRVGGNAELVVEGETGTLVPAKDPHALKNALVEFIEHPDMRTRYGSKGRSRVEQSFSLQAMVKNYLRVYDELMSQAPVSSMSQCRVA